MAIGGKFNKPAAGAAPKKNVKKSRYAGIQAATPRDPMPHVGTYRFRVIEAVEGQNPGNGNESYKVKFEIVDLDEDGARHHKAGDVVVMVQLLTGKGGPSGLQRVKSFVMAAAGYEDESEFDAFDPEGLFIDSTAGNVNAMSERGSIIGRVVDCMVTRGNATADGADYYREFAWAAVGDEDPQQDTAPKAE